MKTFVSFLVSFVFLLQVFVTVQSMPIHDMDKEMSCFLEAKSTTTHTCCSLLSSEKEELEKKNCCSGTSKMSCCITIVAIQPAEQIFNFVADVFEINLFGYQESDSLYESNIFHPPILT